MSDPVIQARRVTRTFENGVVAVNNLDLTVERGAVYGLIGRNGSGKTTVLRLLLGLLKPDRGDIRLLGHDFWTAPRSVRSRVAYVPQGNQLHGWMSVRDLCRYVGHFHDQWEMSYAEHLAKHLELPWTRKVGELSNGEQRKVALMLAFAAKPEVLILDEPGAGFDVISRKNIIDLIIDTLSSNDAPTFLISSHMVNDLERVCSHVGIMDRGRIIKSAELEKLLTTIQRAQVVFQEAAPPDDFSVPGAINSRTEGPVVTATVHLVDERQLNSIREIPGARVNVFPLSLEEIFVELVSQSEPVEGPELAEAQTENLI